MIIYYILLQHLIRIFFKSGSGILVRAGLTYISEKGVSFDISTRMTFSTKIDFAICLQNAKWNNILPFLSRVVWGWILKRRKLVWNYLTMLRPYLILVCIMFVGLMKCDGQEALLTTIQTTSAGNAKILKVGVVLDPSFLQSNLPSARSAIEKVVKKIADNNSGTDIQIKYIQDTIIVIPDGKLAILPGIIKILHHFIFTFLFQISSCWFLLSNARVWIWLRNVQKFWKFPMLESQGRI